jgi:hypothetical protein
MLFASRLEPLICAVETRDVSLVPRVVEWFHANLKNPDPATLNMVKREAERLLSGMLKGQAESENHVHIVSALANILAVQDEASMIADGDWKQTAWDTYFDAIKMLIDPETSEHFGQLAQRKRPLFGSSIETTWPYYGYLLREEVYQLLAGLNSIAISHPEIASESFIDGFHNEITGWLRTVQERTTDLWLFAA